MMLRILPSDVVVQPRPDGAIVRSDNPAVEELIRTAGRNEFDITRLSGNSWHVARRSDVLDHLGPAAKVNAREITEAELRYLLGEPRDIQIQRTSNGIEVVVPDPEKSSDFMESIKHQLGGNPDFVLEASTALIIHVVDKRTTRTENPELPTLPEPDKRKWGALSELEDLAHPPVEIATVGDSVSLRAKNPAHNADRAAIVRQALAGRTDLVVTTQPDQSLLIKLAPGAHIAPPFQPLRPGQMENAVHARVTSLNLKPVQVTTIDAERVRVRFETNADVNTFRHALSDPFGLSFHMVDETEGQDVSTTGPNSGDMRKELPTGGPIWLRPEPVMSGNMIAAASVGADKYLDTPEVDFRLTDEGKIRFATVTTANLHRRFAVLLNGNVLTAPMIQSPIQVGEGVISGNFTSGDAQAIVRAIRSYREDLPLTIVEQEPTHK